GEAEGAATGGAGAGPQLVAITSCPTGIAHTFMAAEGLRRAAADLGHTIKVETQGSVGARDVLTSDEVAGAEAVIIAADTKVDLSRFVGKPVIQASTNDAMKRGQELVRQALAPDAPVLDSAAGGGDGGGPSGGAPAGGEPRRGGGRGNVVQA